MTKKIQKNTGLGKGLSALIGFSNVSNANIETPQTQNQTETENTDVKNISNNFIHNLDISLLSPNPYQPRIQITEDSLIELSKSIKEHGIIEPLVVTKNITTNKYEIIAGERRWRAAKLAGLTTIPVIIKESSPQEMLEIAIVENIQREDLNPLEEALAIEQLYKTFGLSQEEIGGKLGLSKPTISNKMRLLSLPEEIKKGLLENKISEGHARALLGLVNQDNLMPVYKMILKDNLSVRATEELVRRINKGISIQKRKNNIILDEYTQSIENKLKNLFGSETNLFRSKKGGRIVIKFKDDTELDKIIKTLNI